MKLESGKKEVYHLEIVDKFSEIEKINDFISQLSDIEGIDDKSTVELRIALEEMVCNVVMHGFKKKHQQNRITISFSVKNQVVTTIISDNAPQFNPLEVKPPDLDIAFEDREPGGMGIHLTRNLMDRVSYEYIDKHNILTLEKKFTKKEEK